MLRIIFGFILKLRDSAQNWFANFFDKLRDPETGKITFASPSTLKNIILIIGAVALVTAVLIKILTQQDYISGGAEEFTKEVTPSENVKNRDINEGAQLFDDQLKMSLNQGGVQDPLAGITGNLGSGSGEDLGLTPMRCSELMDKLKNNIPIAEEEKAELNQCLSQNVMGLSPDDLKMAKMLADPNTTQAERDLLQRALRGELSQAEMEVARAMASGDQKARAAVNSGDQEMINAYGKQLAGVQLTDQEKAKLAQLDQLVSSQSVAAQTTGGGPSGSSLSAAPDAGVPALALSGDNQKALEDLSRDVAQRAEDIKAQEAALAQQQIQTSEIAQKYAQGQELSGADASKLQQFVDMKKKLDANKRVQAQRMTEFEKRAASMRKSVTSAIATVKQTLPSGTFVEYEGEELDCRSVPKFAIKKAKPTPKKPADWYDADGNKLTPEEVAFWKLQKKKMAELELDQKNVKNPMANQGLGQQMNVAAMGEASKIGDLNSLFVFRNQALKDFQLSPDTKIPAALDSQILVSDKGGGQQVRFKILENVYEPESNKIVIPKGSTAIAMMSGGSFDAETGIANINIERISIGSGKVVTAKLAVGSGDGTFGLRGQVRDTSWKYLTGAFITAFTGGALGWFSSQVVAPYQDSTAAGQALTGAGLAGSAEVMSKLSELQVAKLQGAAKIFFVPKGVPVVLYAQ